MTNKKLLKLLIEIQEKLNDAENYLDAAKIDLYDLKGEIERAVLDEDKVTLDEVFNSHPYHAL